jgi:hypothetical protein
MKRVAVILGFVASCPALAQDGPTKRVAAVVTEYRHNSHADVIVSRLLLTDMLDGTGRDSPLKLASLYTDQRPPNDISRLLAASHRFPIKATIADALTLGTGRLGITSIPNGVSGKRRLASSARARAWSPSSSISTCRTTGKTPSSFTTRPAN